MKWNEVNWVRMWLRARAIWATLYLFSLFVFETVIMWHGDDTDHKPVLFLRCLFSLFCFSLLFLHLSQVMMVTLVPGFLHSHLVASCDLLSAPILSLCWFHWCVQLGRNWLGIRTERIVFSCCQALHLVSFSSAVANCTAVLTYRKRTNIDWLFAFPYFLEWQTSSLALTLAFFFFYSQMHLFQLLCTYIYLSCLLPLSTCLCHCSLLPGFCVFSQAGCWC